MQDVFPKTPVTFRYFRTAATQFSHQDGIPYRIGEVIVDRPVDPDSASLTYGVGVVPTTCLCCHFLDFTSDAVNRRWSTENDHGSQVVQQ